MKYATFLIGNKRYVDYPITDIDIDKKFVVIQIDGDKHLNIPSDRCEYILEITRGIKPDNFNVIEYLDNN